jgi:hypothetical protein
MPLDVAMEHPNPRVVSDEPQGDRASLQDRDGVSADKVGLAFYHWMVEHRVVATVIPGAVHNLEVVSMLVAFRNATG